MTATDAGAIPELVRTRLEVIELPAYSERDKLAIAQRYLLTRPFDEPGHTTALAPEPAPPAHAAESDTARDGPVVVVDRDVSSVRELEAWLLAAPPPQGAVEPWRTAACTGDVRFEAEAIRRVIQSHTNEAGVADLQAKLAAICRQVARRRRPGGLGPEVVTPATVRELLGEGDALPSAVREAIARERRRLGNPSDGDVAPTNDWIDCLEQLPWTRRADAPIDLAQVRARSIPGTRASNGPRRASWSTWRCADGTRAVRRCSASPARPAAVRLHWGTVSPRRSGAVS